MVDGDYELPTTNSQLEVILLVLFPPAIPLRSGAGEPFGDFAELRFGKLGGGKCAFEAPKGDRGAGDRHGRRSPR